METLFKFLTENSGALSVLFIAAVTVATVVYAILAWKLVPETTLLREPETPSARKDDASPIHPFQPPGGLMESFNASLTTRPSRLMFAKE
jgi:hypothetical protein